MSRSTARTAKPRSIKIREWRSSPAAKSRTRPPGLMSGINRSTQAEGAREERPVSAPRVIVAENCERHLCGCK
jgi:hypothetical protein